MNKDRPHRTIQFSDPNSVPPQEFFNPHGSIVAILEPYDLRRRAALFGEVEEVGISCYDDKSVGLRILPNRMVRSELREARVENVDRIGEELSEAANQFRREIRVKQKLQREKRSRPACEA
jgi:hypothetical protein